MRHLIVTDSEIIHSVAFDPGGEVDALEVVFKSSPDTVYRYEDVTANEFVKLVTADSIGSTFDAMFKKTKKKFTKSQRAPTLKK